jgi:hypothetical protein
MNDTITTMDLRETLKSVMQKEIEKLAENLDQLEPKERLNVLCKLMPYIFPKVEAVDQRDGEPFGIGRW